MDWENAKYFLAVARSGSLAGAGRALGVRHSTVLRRIAQLEQQLGIALFERHPDGYALTAAGRETLTAVLSLEDGFTALERRLSGRDLRLSGVVRVATIALLGAWLCESLARFHDLYPGIRTDLTISPAAANLARHEADIAVRITSAAPEAMTGRRIAVLTHGVYIARSAPEQAADGWIAYDDHRADLPQARWLAARVPPDRIVMRTNNTGVMLQAVRAGLGNAVLPCFAADVDPALRRTETIAGLGQELWLLTHPDLRHTPRVRAVLDFLAAELTRYKPLIEGKTTT